MTFFHVSDLAATIERERLNFVPLGSEEFPPGSLAPSVAKLKGLNSLGAIRFAMESECFMARLILEHAPKTFETSGVDALLVDQNSPAAATVAEHLRLPFISLCTSLPLNREPDIPSPFSGSRYNRSFLSRLRNKITEMSAHWVIGPIHSTLNHYRKQWRLPALHSPDDSFSKLAQLSQMPRVFDFPRLNLPSSFHYTGPWFETESSVESDSNFPFQRLDGRKLVYGSLGTIQSSSSRHFEVIAEACSALDVQLVLSLGAPEGTPIPDLPGDNHIVVNFAPQTSLLKRAALTVTHSGMNTTLQTLHFGQPVIAVPLTHDQPAIAARLQRTGAGIVIKPNHLTPAKLREAISAALPENSGYRARAKIVASEMRQEGGVEEASNLIELSFGIRTRAVTAR